MISTDRKHALVYSLLAAIIIAGVLGGNAYRLTLRPLDSKTGCADEIERKTVIVIDQTKALPDQTRAEIAYRALEFVRTHVKKGDLVSVFSVTDRSSSALLPDFTHCMPKSDGNPLVESSKSIDKIFRQTFLNPLSEALNKRKEQSKHTPIAQALINISLSKYFRGAKHVQLLLFSDMLESTSDFSIEACEAPKSVISTFRASRSGAVQRPTFLNASIYLHFVPRTHIEQRVIACRKTFWVWFFGDDSGPESVLVPDNLPG